MYEIYAKIRDEKGYKDFNVSKATGISPATLSDWKKGRYSPKADKIKKIAEFLGVSVEYLETGKETEKTSDSGQQYYFNDETARIAQEIYDNPDLRLLFDAAVGTSPEVMQHMTALFRQMKGTNPDG